MGSGYKGNEGQQQETDIQDEPWSSPSYATTGTIWVHQYYHIPGMQKRGRDHNVHVAMPNSLKPRMEKGPPNRSQKRRSRKKIKIVDIIRNQDVSGGGRNQQGGPHGSGEERFL